MRDRSLRNSFTAVSLLGLLVLGCGQLGKLRGVSALRNSLIKKYQAEDAGVNLQGSLLRIVLINTGAEKLPENEQLAQAVRVGLFVRASFTDIASVTRISIIFAGRTGDSVFDSKMSFSREYDFDKFTMSERKAPEPKNRAAAQPKVIYSKERDETQVSSDGILLYGQQMPDGTTRGGMQLLPHFVIKGKTLTAPNSVDLDLAAFSPVQTFLNDHAYSLGAGDELLAKGTAHFASSGKLNDGQTAEFMTIKLSYANFRKLVSSEQAALKIGPKMIVLGPEQLKPLRDMALVVEVAQADQANEGGR
ncbi:MAG: hypothetical protein ABIP75_02865 [Pyrinomonadaceae bacterium]